MPGLIDSIGSRINAREKQSDRIERERAKGDILSEGAILGL
jgi:hypothetical protein